MPSQSMPSQSMSRRMLIAATVAAAAAVIAPQQLVAQTYPTRPVTIIVPTTAGGGTDIIARLIGEQLTRQLGQTFLVENRPGAGLVVGTQAGAQAAPDGYTLTMGLNGSMAVNPSLFAKLPYHPIRDFTPVAMLADYPFLVVVSNKLPVKSIKDLIALGKAKPGQIHYASAGNGTGQHLSMELFKMLTGTDFVHVPYRGAQPAYVDVISGQVPIFFDNMATAMSLVKGGKVRTIAITSPERSKLMPDVPTIAESGLPGFGYHTWFGMWAPKNTPRPIVEKLNAEIRKALANPEVVARIAKTAGIPSTMKLDEIEPFLKDELEKWAKVVKAAGIKVQ